jgi:hypothetical protein
MNIPNSHSKTGPTERCPSTRELVKSFSPKASKRTKDKIIDHINECEECRNAFSILKDVVEQDTQNELRETDSGHTKSIHGFSFRYAALAAGLLLIASSIMLLIRPGDIPRTGENIRTAFSLIYPRSSHPISKPLVFRWEAYRTADRYVLEVFDEGLLPVWTSEQTVGTQITIADPTSIGLEAGRPFYWAVIAYSGEGKVGESDLCRFTVTR